MAKDYLNLSGLSHFLGKVKTWAEDAFAKRDSAISSSDTDKGIKVSIGGTVTAPTIDIETTVGEVSDSNSGVVSGESVYNSALLKVGGTMSGDITMGVDSTTKKQSAIKFGQSTSDTWQLTSGDGFKILQTVGAYSDGAPSNYSVGIGVCGYYKFALASDAVDSQRLKYYSRSTDGWQTVVTDKNASSLVAVKATNGVDLHSMVIDTTNNTTFGTMDGKTVNQLRAAIDVWHTANAGKENVSLKFSASNAFITLWNSSESEDWEKPLAAGTTWTLTAINNITTDYSSFLLSTYLTDFPVYYIQKIGGVWQKIRKNTLSTDSIRASGSSSGISVSLGGTLSSATITVSGSSSGITSTSNTFVFGKEVYDYAASKDAFTGAKAATSSSVATAGTKGLVPAPSIGSETKYLRGDGTWATQANATVNANGLMSSTDKKKLDNLASVATTGSYADLTNKPTIPTIPSVGNGTISIKNGTTELGSFTTNQSAAKSIDISRITEQTYTGSVFIGTSFSNATGWFRIAETKMSRSASPSFRVTLFRNYSYAQPESYTFDITTSYTGEVSITQVSGMANISTQRLIDKIRVVRSEPESGSGLCYFDFHVGKESNQNRFYWLCIGNATSLTGEAVLYNPTIASTDKTFEFTTVDGFKTNGKIYEGDESLDGKYAQKAFSNITTPDGTFSADSAADTLVFAEGSNIQIGYDAENDKITISATDTTYNVATTQTAGLMSTSMVSKLAGIAENANNYSLPNATDSTLGGVKVGSNISVESGTISLTKSNITSALGYTPPASDTNTTYVAGSGLTLTGTSFSLKTGYTTSGKNYKVQVDSSGNPYVNVPWTDNNTTYTAATTSNEGLMTTAMVTKLNGIAEGANNYSLPPATTTTLGGVKIGSNISNSSGVISLSKTNVTNALGYTPPTTNTTYSTVTSSTTGLAPAIGTTAASTIGSQSSEWVLASSSGGTPSWRQLPSGAFVGRAQFEYDLGSYYSYANGCLIKIGAASAATMVAIHITGNGYGAGAPIDSLYQFYDYNASGGIINGSGMNLGTPLGGMKVYRYDGSVYAWIKQSGQYQTLSFRLMTNKNDLTPTVSNAAAHTSSVSNLVTITPKSILAGNTAATADWRPSGGKGVAIFNTVNSTPGKDMGTAPSNYSTGLCVSGCYSFIIANDAGTGAMKCYRNSTSGWETLITSTNIGSQSVASATNATNATNVAGTSATADAARHVWFSNSATETKRAYDDDFMYNPSTNELTAKCSDSTKWNGYSISVVSALPSSPDANTLYIIKA